MKRRVILMVFCLSLLVPAFGVASQYRQGRHRLDCGLYRSNMLETTRQGIRCDLPPPGWNGRGDRIWRCGADIGGSDRKIRDADGDGIPNGRDPDFKRAFVDENGDGICDHRWNSGDDAK